MAMLIELHKVAGLTVTDGTEPNRRDILINETGQWFQVTLSEGIVNLLRDMVPDSTHWLLYGQGKAAMVRVECPTIDFIPATREVIKLINKHDSDNPIALIPLSVIEVNQDKTVAKVFAPFKSETWELQSYPNENWRLNLNVLKD